MTTTIIDIIKDEEFGMEAHVAQIGVARFSASLFDSDAIDQGHIACVICTGDNALDTATAKASAMLYG